MTPPIVVEQPGTSYNNLGQPGTTQTQLNTASETIESLRLCGQPVTLIDIQWFCI